MRARAEPRSPCRRPSGRAGLSAGFADRIVAWQRDHGFRIDHALLSPELADRLVAAGVDKEHRGREKASDHAPVWVTLRA